MTAHHRIPRNEDGGDNIENLITLCSPCHDYVEINNLRTISDIIGSYEKETVKPKPQKTYTKDEDYSFTRPDWHRWVYGAGRNGI
jgi:5-methylcytosine-specific restriction endonuclease McrA